VSLSVATTLIFQTRNSCSLLMANARVKHELEDRLHEMVCNGELDLSTAERVISTEWIVAYKKYFHTDRPL
jgi:hypothetical protein